VLPGRTGLLVPPDDAGALIEALSALLGDAPGREAMGREARALAERDHSWKAVAARYLELFGGPPCAA